jgi:hypothetical protein
MTIFSRPFVVFVFSLLALWLSAEIGAFVSQRLRSLKEDVRADLGVVISACLTLLALIIGFSFSMAVSRYDQRKNYEEEEANAIGTEYVRASLLPAPEAAKVRNLLKNYLDQRLLFYTTRDPRELERIDSETAKLQSEMWSMVEDAARAQPTPPIALTVSGMNDVLNRQGYTQAAWLNRIPVAAWSLMVALGVCCSLLIGFAAHQKENFLFTVIPFVVSVAFFLIADIDSPRRGVIRVPPQNLISLSQMLRNP